MEVAHYGLDNIAHGAVEIASDEARAQRARQRSVVDRGGEAIRTFSTPPPEATLKK